MKFITEMGMICPKCNWSGIVGECEADIDGDGSLGCPKCKAIVEEDAKTKLYRKLHNKKAVIVQDAISRKEDIRLDYQRKLEKIELWYQQELRKLEK